MSVYVTNKTSTSISVSTTNTGRSNYLWEINGIESYTTSSSHTFTNLTPNTTYTIRCYFWSSGTWLLDGSITETTLANDNPPAPNPPSPPWHPPYVDYRVEGGYRLYWPVVSGATSYTLRVRRGYDNYTTTYNTSSTAYTVTGLQYGVTYYVSVRSENSAGSSNYTIEQPATVAPRTPNITGTSTSNSITISISGMSGNYDEVVVDRYTNNNVYIDNKTASSGTSTLTWTGLQSGQSFIFKARSRLYVNNTWLESVSEGVVQVQVGGTRPNNYSWTTPKTSGQPFSLTASEWNSFTARINQFRIYKGLGAFSFTTATTGNYFLASMFNQAVTAISAMSPPTPPPAMVSSGGIIYASYLNGIVNSLNSIP